MIHSWTRGGAIVLICASAGEDGALDTTGIPITYPADAFRQGSSGFVPVQFDVDARGRVTRVRIVEADPHDRFNHAREAGPAAMARAPRILWNTSANILPIELKLPTSR